MAVILERTTDEWLGTWGRLLQAVGEDMHLDKPAYSIEITLDGGEKIVGPVERLGGGVDAALVVDGEGVGARTPWATATVLVCTSSQPLCAGHSATTRSSTRCDPGMTDRCATSWPTRCWPQASQPPSHHSSQRPPARSMAASTTSRRR